MSHKHGTILNGINSLERLKDRCTVDPINDCWHWGLSSTDGLPNVRVCLPDGTKKKMKGRRAALVLATGEDLPSGWFAIRSPSCPSKGCCNPDHSFMGTGADFGRAVAEIGTFKNSPKRIAANRKISNSKRKLTDEQAAEIRVSVRSDDELAREYMVSRWTIHDIRNGRRYPVRGIIGSSIFSMGENFRRSA